MRAPPRTLTTRPSRVTAAEAVAHALAFVLASHSGSGGYEFETVLARPLAASRAAVAACIWEPLVDSDVAEVQCRVASALTGWSYGALGSVT